MWNTEVLAKRIANHNGAYKYHKAHYSHRLIDNFPFAEVHKSLAMIFIRGIHHFADEEPGIIAHNTKKDEATTECPLGHWVV
ncbi:hypothetical protein [Colwellia piezophila]|uniref:hypothetical protein n=1 Tax=Colwellia piezophila TaxID=211668 RepID=UPI0003749B10|nr:hypothetical protein [Colwellia piezophila]